MLSIILVFCTALLVSIFGIPSIITVAKLKNLYDSPNERKLHTHKIPRLGGLAIFTAFFVGFSFWAPPQLLPNMQYLTAALFILFLAGIKDDILILSPSKKLVVQVVAAGLICIANNIRVTSFYGLFGIEEIPYFVSVPISMFTIIVVTNSFNLIDGVDGLAGGLGFIISLTFALWFNFIDQTGWSLLAFALAGAILGFLFFNFNNAKIFMGDAGSLTVGFLIAVFTIQFIQFNHPFSGVAYRMGSAPALAIAILIVPLYDTLRVFILRILKKGSPFKADKNHIHHWLLKMGMNHREVSFTLYTVNILFILISFSIKDYSTLMVLSIVFGLALVIGQVPVYIYRHRITDMEVEETKILNFEIDEKMVLKEYKN